MVYYGLLLFFALEYIRPSSYFPALNAFHLNSLVPLAVLFGSVFTKKVKMPDVLGSPSAHWIMFLLFLLVISGLICDVKMYAITVFEMVLGYFFMFIVLKKEIYDLDRVKGLFTTLILVHLAVGALTPEMFSGDGERHYIATGAFLGDGNDFALSVNIAIPLCLFMISESQGVIRKLFYTGMLAVLIIAVVQTQSRGGIVALACVALFYWAKNDRKIIGVIGMVLVLFLIVAVAPPQFYERMQTMTKTGDEMEGSAAGRIAVWGASLRMVADHPITGVGAGHFPVKYGVEYRPEGVGSSDIPWQTAHSSYFLILGELGIPGIIFLFGIMLSNFIAGERMSREMKARRTERDVTCRNLVIALNASMVAFAIGGAFLSAPYYPHIYMLAALLECGRQLCKEAIASEAVVRSPQEGRPLVFRGASVQ
ncbi:MAG: O-antigen ligase family protein [Nitrospirota bacterium]|jgi:probable O-glycosylation ligase (exosortase A-associated)|nr:O-antigen ligase family protein [Nitrospirota bacterium]